MECRTIEKLLPLYVGGDVNEVEAIKVRAHLSSCSMCRSAAEEYSASQKMVHAFVAPEFDEEFYAQLRGAVLAGISSGRLAQPSSFQTFRLLFLRRQALATASLALLVTFAALSALLYRGLSNSSARMVAVERSVVEVNPVQFTRISDAKQEAAPISKVIEREARRLSSALPVIPQQKPRRDNQAGAPIEGLSSVNNAGAAATTARAGTGIDGTINNSSGQAVARMEIQTSDPNIRIIWLARKSSE